ncbi:NUDIX domain-containing protein [Patescibacteria group bacterium]|nr:NUDIX domain-containing protein [Patescibacteria group bacterium]
MKKEVICHDNQKNEFLVAVEKFRFRPSVYGLLIHDGKILLSPQHDGYDFPGGGVNMDESLEEALQREFWEETGLKIKLGQIIEAHSSFYKPGVRPGRLEDEYWNCQLIYFLVEQTGGELSLDYIDDDEKGYLSLATWIDIDKLDNLKFYNQLGSKGSVDLIRSQIKN